MTDIELHVLLAVGRGAAHGYAIGKDVEGRTEGRIDPSTGALYQALRRLTHDGLLRPTAAPAGEASDPRRKYFALTEAGRRAVIEEVQRLESLIATARSCSLYSAGA